MTDGGTEFSRPVRLARLGGGEPYRQEIAADAAERDALARRFDLLALDRLTASVELVRRGADLVVLHAAFEARFVQQCVVTLEPVPGELSATFDLVYGPPEAEETAGLLGGGEPAFEPLDGETIDIGEAVAQEFSLALPAFPRGPGADTVDPAAEQDGGPLAALAALLGGRVGDGDGGGDGA